MLIARVAGESAGADESAGPGAGSHPKDVLYREAYDPLARAWFEALFRTPRLPELMNDVPAHDLLTNLLRFNALCHDLVDDSLDALHVEQPGVVKIVHDFREHVLWAGHMPPGASADLDEIKISLSGKMKRNVSLGVIEALICLESAVVFCREQLGLRGDALVDILARSRQLYASLAVLHDEQERVRLAFLTSVDGALAYPQVDYHDVLNGAMRIPPDRFVISGGDAPRLRFASVSLKDVLLDSPIRRCPAHRLRTPDDPDRSLNDALWDLLIDIYRRSGRLD